MKRLVVTCLLCSPIAAVAQPDGTSSLVLSERIPLAVDVVPADSDTQKPGRPAIATDGERYLTVSCRENDATTELFAVLVSDDPPRVVRSVPLAALNPVYGCSGRDVAVAFGGNSYLVAFTQVTDTGSVEIAAVRVSRAGTLLDASSFQILADAGDVAVAFDGSTFLVVGVTFNSSAGQHDIVGAFVSPGGTVGDRLTLTSRPGSEVQPSVSSDGQNFLVVWSDSATGSPISPDADVLGVRVAPTGMVLDDTPIPVSTAARAQYDPHVTFGRGTYFVAWTDTRNDTGGFPPQLDIYGARVSPGGIVRDGSETGGGIPINASTLLTQRPAASFDGTYFLIVWDVSFFYEGTVGVFGARIDVSGRVVDGPSDGTGIAFAAPSCVACRLVHPNAASRDGASLIVWLNNAEVSGSGKDIEALVATAPLRRGFLRIGTSNMPSHWGLNTRQRLGWTYAGDAAQFQIDVSRDGGATWALLEVVDNRPGGAQNFYWTVTGPRTRSARLRVSAVGDEEATDVNDADIQIADATIKFIKPSAASVLSIGSVTKLFFAHNLGARKPIAIDVSNDDGARWRPLVETLTKGSISSSFHWKVDALPTSRARVRIRALDGSGARAISEPFTIRAAEIEITSGHVGGQMLVDPFNGSWSISGPGVLASGIWPPSAPCDVNAASCREGDMIDFSTSAGGSHEDGLLHELVLDDVRFAAADVSLSVTVAPVRFRPGLIRAPFTLRGVVKGVGEDGQAVVTRVIVGAGTMTATVEALDCCGEELFTTSIGFNVEAGLLTAVR